MTDESPRAIVRPEPVRLPSERFTRGGETVTSEEWERLHDRTYGKDRTRDACLQHALTYGEREGVWGGTSSRERRKLQREFRRRACRQCGELFEAASSQQRLCGDACRVDHRAEGA